MNGNFPCVECGGDVRCVGTAGRMRNFGNGRVAEIPETYPVPTCDQCGEYYLTEAMSEELEELIPGRSPWSPLVGWAPAVVGRRRKRSTIDTDPLARTVVQS